MSKLVDEKFLSDQKIKNTLNTIPICDKCEFYLAHISDLDQEIGKIIDENNMLRARIKILDRFLS